MVRHAEALRTLEQATPKAHMHKLEVASPLLQREAVQEASAPTQVDQIA